MRELVDIFASLIVPLRSLIVAAAGAYAASLWFRNGCAAGAVLATIVIIGYVVDILGRGLLPEHPVAAIYLMEGWTVVPVAVGIAAAATIVILTVNVAAPPGASETAKEIATAYTAALTAFAASAIISREIDKTESPVARRIRDAFHAHYKTLVHPGSLAERLVYGDQVVGVDGWGYRARRVRAKRLFAELF